MKPLVIDLDGTLLKSDLLYECAFAELGRRPHGIFGLAVALAHGKAALKHHLALASDFDPSILPYDETVLAYMHCARTDGRSVFLASASSALLVGPIAEHLHAFDGWFASDVKHNLSGPNKAHRLAEAFGEGGFDYIGNDTADLPVWRIADKAIAIRTSPTTIGRLRSDHPNVEVIETPAPGFRAWLKLLRVHQYAKNALVFVAMFTSHSYTASAAVNSLLAFTAFSLCASAVYIVNDMVDLKSDRTHPTKRQRQLANGSIAVTRALSLCPMLLVAGAAIALAVSPALLLVLAIYLALTTSYSFYIKRKFMLDVIVLSALYTIRVAAGAVAIDVVLSEWLVAFSMLMFTSLALIKRHIELTTRLDTGLPDSTSRNYKTSDLPIVLSMASASGFNAITVLTLYVASDNVRKLYTHPQLLWMICPIILYWLGRTVMLAHRRAMHDDPIVFALKDPISILAVVLIGAIMLVAS